MTMDQIFNIALVGLVVVAIYLALQPRYLFVVRIQDGVARLAKGKLTKMFLDEVALVCADARIMRGWIGGLQRGKRVVLAFSRTIPPSCRQRLRNLWVLPR